MLVLQLVCFHISSGGQLHIKACIVQLLGAWEAQIDPTLFLHPYMNTKSRSKFFVVLLGSSVSFAIAVLVLISVLVVIISTLGVCSTPSSANFLYWWSFA